MSVCGGQAPGAQGHEYGQTTANFREHDGHAQSIEEGFPGSAIQPGEDAYHQQAQDQPDGGQ